MTFYVEVSGNANRRDGTTGARNETGEKRVRAALKTVRGLLPQTAGRS